MEQCPLCKTERISDMAFCEGCGHKFATAPEPASESVLEPEPMLESTPEPEQQDIPKPQDTDMSDSSQDDAEPKQTSSSSQGAIYIRSDSGELCIDFADIPKAVGRDDVKEFLLPQGTGMEKISRQHFTISREGDEYYIEDGVTSVQSKPSTNGTSVNGNNIRDQGRTKLTDGDKILFYNVNAIFRMS